MAKPWQIVDSVVTGEGLLELRRRGEEDYLITIGGRLLMNSLAHRSEVVLAELACSPLRERRAPRVLVGGLGMGYTLRAALDNLPGDARVVVAELNPVVVEWCRGPIAHLTGSAVTDPRVTVAITDVAELIRQAASRGSGAQYDAIVLDLYEGPHEGMAETEYLYGDTALALSAAALTPGGLFAVWAEEPDQAFEERLRAARFSVEKQRPGRGGRRHMVYIARPGGIPSARGRRDHRPGERGRSGKR